jgi:ribosomal protein S18 acetylase RimI-like enzyme
VAQTQSAVGEFAAAEDRARCGPVVAIRVSEWRSGLRHEPRAEAPRLELAVEFVRLCEAADRNVAEAVRHFARHADGAVLIESASNLRVASATAVVGAFHNAVMRVIPGADPRVVLADMQAFGDAHRREVVLWASTHADGDVGQAAHDAGLRLVSTAVGMAIRTPPAEPVVSAMVELVEISDTAGVAAFADIHQRVFGEAGEPPAAVAHFASSGALLAPTVSAFVAHVNGRAVSCAMVMSTGREAGVYWVATRPDARNQGYGELVTRAATRAAFEHGASVVVLQATKPGVPLYRKIGFASFTSYRRYLRPPPTPRLPGNDGGACQR